MNKEIKMMKMILYNINQNLVVKNNRKNPPIIFKHWYKPPRLRKIFKHWKKTPMLSQKNPLMNLLI